MNMQEKIRCGFVGVNYNSADWLHFEFAAGTKLNPNPTVEKHFILLE